MCRLMKLKKQHVNNGAFSADSFFFLRPMFMRCNLKGHFSLKSHKEARETLPTDLLAKQRNIPDEKS